MSFGGYYNGRRVLVTGSTGFKGSWLCAWLGQLGATVQGFALAPTTTPSAWTVLGLEGSVTQHLGDVRELPALMRVITAFQPEVVFHLAAQPLVRDSYLEPKATFDINVGGTVNLLEAVRATPSVAACVVVTTDKCYENREWAWGYRESDHLGGHDPYSASKGAAELVVASYRRSFFASSGPALASARAGNVIGGGDWSRDRLVADFMRALATGSALALRNPRATRPWQHVLEPLSGYLELARRLAGPDGRRFAEAWNFGPEPSSVVPVEQLARSLVRHWGSGEVVLAPDHRLHEAGALQLDCSKARQLLGWHGVWDVEQAVAATCAWYRRHLSGGGIAGFTAEQIAGYQSAAANAGLPWVGAGKASHG